MTYEPSSDEERELSIALRNTIGINTWRLKAGLRLRPMDLAFKRATWWRKLDLLQWQAKYRRRHPHNPITPSAA